MNFEGREPQVRWNLGPYRDQVPRRQLRFQMDEVLQRAERQGQGGVDERSSGVIPAAAVEAGSLAVEGPLGVARRRDTPYLQRFPAPSGHQL